MSVLQDNQIRSLRKRSGLSQQALAERAKCSIQWVRALEGGLAPDPDKSPKYRRVLSILNENDPAMPGEAVRDRSGRDRHVEG